MVHFLAHFLDVGIDRRLDGARGVFHFTAQIAQLVEFHFTPDVAFDIADIPLGPAQQMTDRAGDLGQAFRTDDH
ncbi:Uncharacterised protein [Mycobacteroides abscessus subsp. abscessus]|nr:Uncharacterised protein [Mycobacteroides abscessus subsp. abscessus]